MNRWSFEVQAKIFRTTGRRLRVAISNTGSAQQSHISRYRILWARLIDSRAMLQSIRYTIVRTINSIRTKQKLPWPGTAVSVFCRLLSRFQAKFGMILFLQQLLGLNFGTRASPSLPSHGKGAWVQTAWIPCGIRGCWSGCLISTIKAMPST